MCILAVSDEDTSSDLGGSKPKKKNNTPLALTSVWGHQSHYQVDLGPVVGRLISANARINFNPGFCSCVKKDFLG